MTLGSQRSQLVQAARGTYWIGLFENIDGRAFSESGFPKQLGCKLFLKGVSASDRRV